MKALLICPDDRPGVARLADHHPLALSPVLGKSVLESWIEALARRGAKHILVLATDRPDQVRGAIGDGARWGLRIEIIAQSRELTVAEARAHYRARDPASAAGWLESDDIVLLDFLPGLPALPLFESYASWFAALQAWLPHAVAPARIGTRELQPGVWVGLHSQIAPDARLVAPCFIGENVVIGTGATIGPDALIDDRVVIGPGAQVRDSVVWPETYVGRLVSVRNSLADGSLLLNCETGSCLRVPDAFLLGPLDGGRFERKTNGIIGRTLALAALIVTAPIALGMALFCLLRGEAPLRRRQAVRPRRTSREHTQDTFAYYELTGAGNWLRRWPQFWSVVRGDLVWVGNRPLRPAQAFALVNDFERLWFARPPGLVSLADAAGCPEGVTADSCAHASFYAVNASARLDATIIARAMLRAAMSWPLYLQRRPQGASIPGLVTTKEG